LRVVPDEDRVLCPDTDRVEMRSINTRVRLAHPVADRRRDVAERLAKLEAFDQAEHHRFVVRARSICGPTLSS
jgi:hypothetical protein